MTATPDQIAEIAGKLTKADTALFRNARVYSSGVWLGGRCSHLYGDGLCRMTGELTELGLAVRHHIKGASHDE